MPLIDVNFEKFLYDGSSWYGIDGGESHLEHVEGIPPLGLLCTLRAHRRQQWSVCASLGVCAEQQALQRSAGMLRQHVWPWNQKGRAGAWE